MYDAKKVRRRRAVFAGLLVLSLLLLTAYFGESIGGPFHTLQRGVQTVLTPLQDGASRALKPGRDLVNWFGDTFHAKTQRDKLRKENQQLRAEAFRARAALAENRQLRGLVGLDSQEGLARLRPQTARVIGRSPSVWYSSLELDKGSGDGVRVDQPVVAGGGLVGRVSSVTGGSSVVTLITDHTSGVSAKVLDRVGDFGIVVPEIGTPGRLLIQTLPPHAQVRPGDLVVTAGTRDPKLRSLFPANVPIGTISSVSPDELALSQQAHVAPAADLRHLDFVQVLTAQGGETLSARAP